MTVLIGLGELACRYIPVSDRELCASAIQRLHDLPPLNVVVLKVVFMLFVLYLMLWVLARSNRIKRSLRWPKKIPNWGDIKQGDKGILLKQAPTEQGATFHSRFIRLPSEAMEDGTQEMYNNRIADVTFVYEGAKCKKFNYKHPLKVYVASGNNNGDNDYGYAYVDQSTWTALDNDVRANTPEEQIKPALKTCSFSVEMRAKRFRAVSFLLFRHPDATFRITGWVTVLTAIYTIIHGIVFAS